MSKQVLITTRIHAMTETAASPTRDSIGGTLFLPPGLDWPECSCGKRMALFLQFEVRRAFGLPFNDGAQFALLMCPEHNDAPVGWPSGSLPPDYWTQRLLYSDHNPGYELFLF